MIATRLKGISKRALLGVSALLMFLSMTVGPLTMVAEAVCTAPSIAFGRWRWCGYWMNRYDPSGDSVRIGGVPVHVDSADEFIAVIDSDLASGNANRVTGASFVIQTMIGSPLPNPAQGFGSPTTPRPPTADQRNEWVNRIRGYSSGSTAGWWQAGPNGTVEWWGAQHLACGSYNTYWQGNGSGTNPNDIAPYYMEPGNSDCEIASVIDSVIVFRDTAGNEVYKIRRDCMNPLGTLNALNTYDPTNFSLEPDLSAVIYDGATTVPGSVAEVGDRVTFTYAVRNNGTTASSTVNCSVTGRSYPGYQNPGTSGPLGGTPVAGVVTGCPRSFPTGPPLIWTEVINLNTSQANQTICRQIEVSPRSNTDASALRKVLCIQVANKPYSKVFNGDISVGGGFASGGSNTCAATTKQHASVVGWNRRAANGYNGAGTRHAIYALEAIFDFSSAQHNAGAAMPKGLSFANTSSNVNSGWYGGRFGSTGCVPDYFAARPAADQPWKANINAMSDGTGGVYYSGSSTTLAGGNVNNNSKVSVYVDGDLHITGDIQYGNNFNVSSMPLLQIVVRGNIYIHRDVTRLDGIYIAQPTGATTKGAIYTCASDTAFTVVSRTAANYFTQCNKKLTVNGVFTARQINLMRTAGSLKSATAGETSESNNAGEAFSYSPAFWMQQPRSSSGADTYDAITSLPPIL